METDIRSRRIVFLAHCLLNQNAKVPGLAVYQGTFEPLVSQLNHAGVGIVQMPCPEALLLGLSRPLGTDTREQYETPEYRNVCRIAATRIVEEVAAYRANGYEVCCLLGVEGSPSCSVTQVPHLARDGERVLRPGSGIFIEAVREQLDLAGVGLPMIGIPEAEEGGSLAEALCRVARLMSPARE